MRPFVILALPRTGTKMLVSALQSHPDMPDIIHEFKGSYHEFIDKKYVLSNTVESWMKPPIKIMHLGRTDTVDHALSLLKMSYTFPDGEFELPMGEVAKLAKDSFHMQMEMEKIARFSITYEELTAKVGVNELARSEDLCEFFEIKPRKLITVTQKRPLMRASNEVEICAALKT